jgi:hypothetical protein
VLIPPDLAPFCLSASMKIKSNGPGCSSPKPDYGEQALEIGEAEVYERSL